MSDLDPPSPSAPAAVEDDDRPEQLLRFSDRRTVAAFLAGIVVLAAIGIVGGALFRDPCDPLFTVGERRTFVQGDPAEVLPGDTATAQEYLTYGERAGIGAWRGSVVLDPGTEVVAAPDGFLVFTDVGIDALEPGLMAVNASRSSAGGRIVPALHGAAVAAGQDAPFDVAVLDEDLALIGCGTVRSQLPILDLDRVRSLHADGATLLAEGLDGQRDWERGFDHEVVDAHLLLGAVLVITRGDVHLVDLAEGRTLQRWPLDGAELLALDGLHAIVQTPRRTVQLSFVDGRTSDVDVVPTAGVALLVGAPLVGADLPTLPGPVELLDVHATEGAYVGLEVDTPEARRLLLYGPALPPG